MSLDADLASLLAFLDTYEFVGDTDIEAARTAHKRLEAEVARLRRGGGWRIRAEAAECEVARLQEGLRKIADNAEAWHGPEGLDTGHARSLGVIANEARALLAEDTPGKDGAA